MTSVVLADLGEHPWAEGYPVATCTVSGGASGTFHRPEGFSIWIAGAAVAADAEILWPTMHGEEIVFVERGQLQVDGKKLGTGSAVVIEANAQPVVRVVESTMLVHFGDSTPRRNTKIGKPAATRGATHLVGEQGTHRGTFEGESGPVHSWFYADSTCPTCRPTLLRNAAHVSYRAPSHVHSQDEIIYVLSGAIQVGQLNVTPGMALSIPRDHRYGFRSKHGFDFINFRADQSTVVVSPGSEPTIESAAGFGMQAVAV